MADALDVYLADERLDRLDVDLGRGQQLLAEALAELIDIAADRLLVDAEGLAHEGIAVGMYARGRNADQRIARLDGRAVDHLLLVDHADREAGHVVLVYRIEARHLGGLAADQRAACLTAALCDARYHLRDLCGLVFADCDIVEEEQRLCTAAGDVVDAHGNAVDADRVMLVHQERQLELGAHAVRAGDQNGVGHALELRAEQTAEAAERTHNALDVGALDHRLHQLDCLVTCGDVYTGCLVALRTALTHIYTLTFQKVFTLCCREGFPSRTYSSPPRPVPGWGTRPRSMHRRSRACSRLRSCGRPRATGSRANRRR